MMSASVIVLLLLGGLVVMAIMIYNRLTRLRNATLARHDKLTLPGSKLKVRLAKVLKEEGFIADYVALLDARRLGWPPVPVPDPVSLHPGSPRSGSWPRLG